MKSDTPCGGPGVCKGPAVVRAPCFVGQGYSRSPLPSIGPPKALNSSGLRGGPLPKAAAEDTTTRKGTGNKGTDNETSFQVAVRARPLNARERLENQALCCCFDGTSTFNNNSMAGASAPAGFRCCWFSASPRLLSDGLRSGSSLNVSLCFAFFSLILIDVCIRMPQAEGGLSLSQLPRAAHTSLTAFSHRDPPKRISTLVSRPSCVQPSMGLMQRSLLMAKQEQERPTL